jgi:DNA polymerase (family 10)
MNENNSKISALLKQVAIAYTLHNENRFRIIAYEKASETIQYLTEDIFDIYKRGDLDKVEGIGPNLVKHLSEYFTNPKDSYLLQVISEIPASVYLLMNIQGIGPKKAFTLVERLHLNDPKTAIQDLKKAALAGQIAEFERFGKKSEDEILKGLELFETNQNKERRMPYPIAFDLAEDILSYLRKNEKIKNLDVLGSLRRKRDTIGDIDIAATCDEKYTKEVIEYFVKYPGKIAIENQGDKKASIVAANGMGIDFRIAQDNTYGSMLQYFTGSKAHNVALREYALKKGLSLSEWGIKDVKTQKLKVFESEKDFYKYIGLEYIEPELREHNGEIENALKNTLPDLVDVKDLRGDFHIHSNYPIEPSHDLGANTPEEIISNAIKKGYRYVGFSEHNPSMSNHTEKEIVEIMKMRHEKMKTIFSKFDQIDCYIGLEVDILPSGELALPGKAIEFVDYLIVSIHSRFAEPKEVTTKRIIKALSYPKVKIFGHPTGRLIEKREGVQADWEEIFAFCASRNIACEINSSPYRLDLPDYLVMGAKKKGVQFTIDSDTHGINEMDNLPYGISVARRAGLEKKDIITTYSKDDLKKWILT